MLPIVLVIEDDDTIQGIVEDALSEGGFEAAIATTGEEAVTLLTQGAACRLPRPCHRHQSLGKVQRLGGRAGGTRCRSQFSRSLHVGRSSPRMAGTRCSQQHNAPETLCAGAAYDCDLSAP